MSLDQNWTPRAGVTQPGGAPPAAPVFQPGRLGWRGLGGLLSVLFIVGGTLSVAGWLARRSEVQVRTYHRVPASLVVVSGSADVSISAGADNQVVVRRQLDWSWSRPDITESWEGDTLRLEYRCSDLIGCSVSYDLWVPGRIPVRVQAAAGNVTARGLTGPLTLSTGSGDLLVSGARSALDLRSGSGDLTALDTGAAEVSASSGSGNVTLDFSAVPRSVSAGASSGDVLVLLPRDGTYRVSADTANGSTNTRVVTDRTAAAVIMARDGSGDITVAYR